jgi:hypothetical protein
MNYLSLTRPTKMMGQSSGQRDEANSSISKAADGLKAE